MTTKIPIAIFSKEKDRRIKKSMTLVQFLFSRRQDLRKIILNESNSASGYLQYEISFIVNSNCHKIKVKYLLRQ